MGSGIFLCFSQRGGRFSQACYFFEAVDIYDPLLGKISLSYVLVLFVTFDFAVPTPRRCQPPRRVSFLLRPPNSSSGSWT